MMEIKYVVLKFSKDIDWLWVQTILGLDNTYSKRANDEEDLDYTIEDGEVILYEPDMCARADN